MTSQEIKQALLNKRKVVAEVISCGQQLTLSDYTVNAVILKADKYGQLFISAELIDQKRNAFTVRIENVRYQE